MINLLLLIELLIILLGGMKLGILMYKNEIKVDFWVSLVIVIIWIIIVFINFGV